MNTLIYWFQKIFKIQINEEVLWEGVFHPIEEDFGNKYIDFIFKLIQMIENFIFISVAAFIVYLYLIN